MDLSHVLEGESCFNSSPTVMDPEAASSSSAISPVNVLLKTEIIVGCVSGLELQEPIDSMDLSPLEALSELLMDHNWSWI